MDEIKSLIVCPISGQIFFDPYIASDGHTYEFDEISEWYQRHPTSPITRETIKKNFRRNRLALDLVNIYLKFNPEELVNQYRISNDYVDNIAKIKNIIEMAAFDKLLKYVNFDGNIINANLVEKCPRNILKYIIDNCSNLECEDSQKWRPIHFICRYSTPKLIKYIINKRVDLECEDIKKWRPIHFICRYSTPKLIRYIIDKGVNLECETIGKSRPINFICDYSTPETIKYIIDKGVKKRD